MKTEGKTNNFSWLDVKTVIIFDAALFKSWEDPLQE